jgi:hypothetical protein
MLLPIEGEGCAEEIGEAGALKPKKSCVEQS